jgi:hypothetical protein
MKQVRRNMHGQCDGKGDRRRHHDDHAQFALDWKVREPAYQKPSGQGIYGGVATLGKGVGVLGRICWKPV